MFYFICTHLLFLCLTAQQFSLWGNKKRAEPWSLRRLIINSEPCKWRINACLYIIIIFVCQISRDCCKSTEEERVAEIWVWYQKMFPLKSQYWAQTKKVNRRKDREAGAAFFRCFIFLMTAEKNKSTDLSSFTFLMVGETYKMRGSEIKSLQGWRAG